MKQELLLAVLLKRIDENFSGLQEAMYRSNAKPGPRGLPGRDGVDGVDGKSFSWEEHGEQIKAWAREFALKFEDLTAEQVESLRGPRGKDGRDGKDFDLSLAEDRIKFYAEQFSLKFENLTPEQKASLKGEPGKDFDFAANRGVVEETLKSLVHEIKDELKLRFSDLTEEEISALRGPRGRDGRDGKDGEPGKDGESFDFNKHRAFFEGLKPKFSDYTPEDIEKLRLKFEHLTDAEKDSLKLRFSDLTDEERASLRGPRGVRGQKGKDGQSIRGLPGVQGRPGLPGINGRDGRDGRDGADAPYVTDIRIDQYRADEAVFVFEFSDGTAIETNPFTLPKNGFGGGSAVFSGGNGGGTWGTITGTLSDQTDLQAALDAKLTNSMNSGKLLGRGSAGVGAIEEITLGDNLSLTGNTLNATGGSNFDVVAFTQYGGIY